MVSTMKKIGILTINSFNLGNRLQNYALQTMIEKMGYSAETILRTKPCGVIKSIKRNIRSKLIDDRFTRFYKFDKNIHWSKCIVSKDAVTDKLGEKYDGFVVGSDQVWNPTFSFNSELDYLPMIDSSKKFAYAASFGVSVIPKEYKHMVKNGLSTFDLISVREDAGVNIVKELTGRDATLVIDPTLMLTKEEWRRLSVVPSDLKRDSHYILTYFLGHEPQKATEEKSKLMRENGWMEYCLLDRANPKVCKAGPCEFLYLIDHAELVLTDSFHGSVFSFLFGKPFYVYAREGKENNMLSRIDTLMKMFSLERKFSGSGLHNDLLEHDYSVGYKALEQERKKAKNYLKSSMASMG